MFSIFRKKSKSILGIDIGTSSIKVVQLKKEEDKFKLENYAELSTVGYLERLNEPFQTTSLRKLEAVTREMLKIIFKEAEIDAKQVVMAIPVFSAFVGAIEMPEMAEKELSRAVEFEARRYVPIPLAEVVLDWKITETGIIKDDISPRPFKGKRILLIAVPKEVVNKYLKIADDLNLKIKALELESFGLARALVSDERQPVCILDVGARATSFTIVDKGTIQMSHSLDVAGAEMTQILATGLGIASKRAEEFKMTYGLDHRENKGEREEIRELLNISIDKIITEVEGMINNYQTKTDRKIEKFILNGGSAQLMGLNEYIEKKTGIKTVIADPWSRIIYPSVLGEKIKKTGPQFSVAIGAAMRQE